jgi:hypothetical protein
MHLNVTAKFTIDSEEPNDLLASIIGCAVRDALEAAHLELAPTGIGIRVTPHGAVTNIPRLEAA